MGSPFLLNLSPIRNDPNVLATTNISFDIVDADGDLTLSSMAIYVSGSLAFDGDAYVDGYAGFESPYNASGSQIYPTTTDGYDGYHVIIDAYGSYANVVTVRAHAQDLGSNTLDGYWGFVIANRINSLYFSDGYGLKRIDVESLVGEAQSSRTETNDAYQSVYSEARTVLSEDTTPSVPNNIKSIFGNFVDGYFCLALSYDSYGVKLCRSEVEVATYSQGNSINKAQMNDDGTLYLINETSNTIEVYYGANFRDGYRSPDFTYSSTSTPSMVAGQIRELHIVSGESTKYDGGTRIYVGTSQGATRIEAYDKGTDGYCDGFDNRGVSIHYGISGSGLQHEVIGGTISNVVSIGSDDDNGVMFVGTNDGAGNGGVTQILITANRKIVFMTRAEGFIPSNDIRDIYGKGF